MRNRMFLKLVVLGVVSIVLMMVLSSIKGLAQERKGRLSEVQCDIASSYAGTQRIAGPVFAVSFREFWSERLYNKEKDTWYDKEMNRLQTKLFFPETFSYAGTMGVQERYRGIFKANVFQSEGRVQGQVSFPEVGALAAKKGSRVELVSAQACFLISDLRGITHVPEFKWNNEALEVSSGSDLDHVGEGIHAKLPAMESLFGGAVFSFEMGLDVHGMGQLEFVPIGAENQMRLASEWPHPSFVGDFLATERTISEEGFTAEWNVNGLACSARQQLESGSGHLQRLGVSLIDPVNIYPLTDRALKYGFLFIFITFSAFVLFEMLSGLKIHPVQYGFVGLAQAVFFLLLLSLSEHLGFGLSYLSASAATIVLITFYVCHILKGVRRGLSFGGLLALLYGVLFALLQSEDHALVAGSALVFGLMTLVMLLTRKVDWYAPGTRQD
ncbi:MAG: cell envelope integrity protein CreD [Verrucomicrobiota bacterium]